MMKKLVLGLFAITLLLSGSSVVNARKKKKDAAVEQTKDMEKKIRKQEKAEKKRLEQERKKAEKDKKKAEKKTKKSKKEKKCKKDKKTKKNKEDKTAKKIAKEQKKKEKAEKKRLEQERKKSEKEQKAEDKKHKKVLDKQHKEMKKQQVAEKKKQSWWDKLFKKEQKSKARQAKLQLRAEDKERVKFAMAEKKEERYWTRLEQKEEADARRRLRKERLEVSKKYEQEKRNRLVANWKGIRRSEVQQDYNDGMYEDLYKKPAWPFEMLFAEHKDLFQVKTWGNYATSAYAANGSSHDLSKLAFGEKDLYFQDLLLALRLEKKGILDNYSILNNAPWDSITGLYYDKKLLFYGESREYGVSLDFARYIKSDNIMIGLQVPFAYKSHRLKFDTDLVPFDRYIPFAEPVIDSYRTQQEEILNWVLAPKGLSYLPKSSITGLGDISTFISFQAHTKYLERWIMGVNVLWPTAKDADTSKLWAPQLGNGFTKVSFYNSVMFNKQSWYFNPHMFIKGTYQVTGHKDRRVPEVITHNGKGSSVVGDDVMAHGGYVEYVEGKAFTELDCEIPVFADNVRSVKVRPGPEVELRLGNMIEKFIFRRSFLDVYYNFRAKWKDHISYDNLSVCCWDVMKLKENTHQLEHKIGLDFAYQFDIHSRLQFGFNWVFAGINVPENIQGTLAVNVEF